MSCEAERNRERAGDWERSQSQSGRGSVEWSGREASWRREKNGAKKPSVLTILFSH